MSTYLVHDVAWMMALHVMEKFGERLGVEHYERDFAESYAIARAGIEAFEVQKAREENRLRPSRN